MRRTNERKKIMVNCFYVLLILFISCIFDYCTAASTDFREGAVTNPLRITPKIYKEPTFSALVWFKKSICKNHGAGLEKKAIKV